MRRGWLRLRVELETIGWFPFAAGTLLLVVTAGLAGTQGPSFASRALLTRLSLTFPAVALPYVLDDRAGELTAALPARPAARTLVRLGVVGVAWLATVGGALLLATRGTPRVLLAGTDAGVSPLGRLVVEAGALAAAGALGAALSSRWWEEDLRMVAAATVGIMFVAAVVAPPEWTPFQTPGMPRWETAGRVLGSWIAGCLAISVLLGSVRAPLALPTRRGRRRRHP